MRGIGDIPSLDLIHHIISFAGITEDDYASQSRKQPIVVAKVLTAYCLLYLNVSNSFIGKIILKKHCTVTHYKTLIMDDRFMQYQVKQFKMFMSSVVLDGEVGVFVPSLEEWKEKMKSRGDIIRIYKKTL